MNNQSKYYLSPEQSIIDRIQNMIDQFIDLGKSCVDTPLKIIAVLFFSMLFFTLSSKCDLKKVEANPVDNVRQLLEVERQQLQELREIKRLLERK